MRNTETNNAKGKVKRQLTPAQRLIVAADVANPGALAEALRDTGIVFKENTSLRDVGCRNQVPAILGMGLQYFGDLKLNDIAATMKRDGGMLRLLKPTMITAMCSAPLAALKALKGELPNCEVLGVTVLTDFDEGECRALYGRSIADQVRHLTERALLSELDGVVCAPKEVPIIREVAGDALTINTPNVRQASLPVKGDDQNPDRARTIAEAFLMGVTRIVMGRPVTQAQNPSEAVKAIIAEIASVVA